MKNSRFIKTGLLIALVASVSGCAGLSGLNGSSTFKCSAPAGVPCQSVTGVHLNERSGNLPAQRSKSEPRQQSPSTEPASGAVDEVGAAIGQKPAAAALSPRAWRAAGATRDAAEGVQPPLGAIRSDPTVIRIWLAPWEDADGDLHDQSYVYLQIDSGRWLIEHNRERIRREFTPNHSAPDVARSQRPAAVDTGATGRSPANSSGGSAQGDGSQAGDAPAEAQAAAAEGRRRAQQLAGSLGVPQRNSDAGARP